MRTVTRLNSSENSADPPASPTPHTPPRIDTSNEENSQLNPDTAQSPTPLSPLSSPGPGGALTSPRTSLRDEYEGHIQRLLMKLSREQQARAEVEDRLETALVRGRCRVLMLCHGVIVED